MSDRELQLGDSREQPTFESKAAWTTASDAVKRRAAANGYSNAAASASAESGLEASSCEPKSVPLQESDQRALPLHRKLLFAVGGLPYQLCGNAYAVALRAYLESKG